MNNDFFERERRMEQDRERAQHQKHQTLETYNLEQQEAHQGHIPDPKGADVEPPQPGFFGRLLKMLGLRK
ncbi:MAG: hypothetical protein IAE80_26710 [Anaerolinea sp.]|nr:hypothetical protein [Anaerolinea sp.]